MSLRWRSSADAEHMVSALADWPGELCVGKVPAPKLPRLRGIASFNGMAVVKLMMKPSSLKTLEALPRNGLAVYLNGSMLNHSCCPTVNRPGKGAQMLLSAVLPTCSIVFQRITIVRCTSQCWNARGVLDSSGQQSSHSPMMLLGRLPFTSCLVARAQSDSALVSFGV